jgi:hypothetical protein
MLFSSAFEDRPWRDGIHGLPEVLCFLRLCKAIPTRPGCSRGFSFLGDPVGLPVVAEASHYLPAT